MAKKIRTFEQWEKEHRKKQEEAIRTILPLYATSILPLVQIGLGYGYEPGDDSEFFTFNMQPKGMKEAKEALSEVNQKVTDIIIAGMVAQWKLANRKNDAFIRMTMHNPPSRYLQDNAERMRKFVSRKVNGLQLSERVWKCTDQYRAQIEDAITLGIKQGKSANAIAKDIRNYLVEPDRLYRRIRDEFGELRLSESAKSYHPGQGVYRSSYQNAIRLAQTEIGIAYCESDYLRWQQDDRIVGIRIKTSPEHASWLAKDWYPRFKKGTAPLEICDQMEGVYPKDFRFVLWHPNCHCSHEPIYLSGSIDSDILLTTPKPIEKTPTMFNKYLVQNKSRITSASNRGKLPYWIKANGKFTDIQGKNG